MFLYRTIFFVHGLHGLHGFLKRANSNM